MINEEGFFSAAKRPPSYMFITPNSDQVAVVERASADRLPAYAVQAQTRCLECEAWCWLGDKSFELIASGGASPICGECAVKLIPPDTVPLGLIVDTLRDDLP